jgi:predicted HTH transcriptional regulator
VIEHYPDRIVMANPGTIIPGKAQMLKGGISEPRNKNLFKMFNLIGVGEHAGSGVPDIYDVWKTEGLMEPTVEEQFGADVPDRTTLTLPLVDINHAVSGVGPEKGPEKGPAKGGKWVVDKEYIQ